MLSNTTAPRLMRILHAQGAAWVFEHILLPFMHEHVSKFDPTFKNAGNVLDNVRAPAARHCSMRPR